MIARKSQGLHLTAARVVLGALALVALVGDRVALTLFGRASTAFAWTDGARQTLLATAAALAVAYLVGTVIGATAAMGPRMSDALLCRAMEVAGAVPSIAALVIARALLPVPNVFLIAAVIAVLRGLETAKIVRAEALQLMANDFFVAARATGSPRPRLFRKHLFPHLVGSALAGSAFSAASVVALEAAVSFLGLSVGASSWGALLSRGVTTGSPATAVFAGSGVLAVVLSLHVLGDAFEDRQSVGRRFV